MSETEQEGQVQETPEAAPAEAAPATPSFDTSQFATKEDLQSIAQGLSYLTQMFQEPEQDVEQDQDEIDIDAYIQRAVDSRMAPVKPLFDATVKERGEKEMQRIFAEAKAEYGDFDPKLAERVATSFLGEHGGDPVEATKAGAKYAAEVRAAERKTGETGYRERLQRGPVDPEPAVTGVGNSAKSKAKSYDEVIERWSGETEA